MEGPATARAVFVAALLAALLLPWTARADLVFHALDTRTDMLEPLTPPKGDGLPPGWHLNVPPPVFQPGASKVMVGLDPATGTVEEHYREADVEVREPLIVAGLDYNELLSDRSYHKVWRERTRTTRSVNKEGQRQGGLFRFELPVQLPKAVRSIVGDGAPNIIVSGSERIAIVGTSDWTVRNDIYSDLTGERKRQGAFPSFEMRQELNVNLTGSIGDKIKVDVDQSSNVATSIDNQVKLRYDGDDDDMIKTIELGNTNLSLQGASLRQEGLFGVKTVMKLGNFDFTTIASKQDAKTETARFTPSGDTRPVKITDLEYIHRRYFFIADHPLPTAGLGLRIYVSSGDVNNDVRGVARLDPQAPFDSLTNPEQSSRWRELTLDKDYDVLYPYTLTSASDVPDSLPPDVDPNDLQIPVIRLRSPVLESQYLAVAYVDGRLPAGQQRVGSADGDSLILKAIHARYPGDFTNLPSGLIDPATPWYPVRDYELKNFYDLQGRNIDPTSLSIKIRRKDGGAATDPDAIDGKPLVEILRLDERSRTGEFGPDGLVDDQFVDVVEGTLFFPDLHPFAPDTRQISPDPCLSGFGGFLCLDNIATNVLAGDSSLANPIVYNKGTPELFKDDRYYIDAEFRSSQQGFFLGRFGILENSEQVKVDGIPQRRDADYRIDYNTGELTFIKVPGPTQVITAEFSYPPGFGQVQRTLVGLSGAYTPASNLSFSSSLLYEARGAQEQNPKLGEEPAHSTLGDFGTVLSFRPVWMTRLADQVPGITTDQPSALNIQGNLSMSVPNPNTKGEAFIDDMEGNRESNTIGLSRLQWFYSSVPVSRFNPRDSTTVLVQSAVADHALLEWYNPRPESPTAAKERDLKPVLTEAEGSDNNHQVLEWNLKPPTGETTLFPEDWAGLTQSLSTTGIDFSRIRFVEIWVNDFDADHDSTNVLLHMSLGRVSEDAYWSKTEPPNGRLDTEDKNRDGKLDGGDPRSPDFEDTGFDGVVSELEPLYDPITNPDPSGDDYRYNVRENPDDYSTINNLEFNGIGEANARPDTEDLNRDTFLDSGNNYFETTIDLADDRYVAIDVPTLYAGNPNVKANNGWRLFRIPVSGETFRRVGSPSWQNIQNFRLWASDATRPIKIQIGGIEFVGSRWLEAAITDPDMIQRDVQLDIRTRNNKDDAGLYEPPFEVLNQVGGTADRREQSLALGYTRLAEGDTVLAFKTLGDPGTGLGWAQYRQIKYYIHGEPNVEAQRLRAIARFGQDTLNYYEYSVPIRSGWQNVFLPMEALSRLKEERLTSQRVFVDSTSSAATEEVYSVVGNPSFTRIGRLTFGLTVKGSDPSDPPATGEVWINELRLADVRKDSGVSSNVSVQANFADLLAVNLSLQKQDQDFFRVGQGGNQGTGLDHTAVGFSTTLQADRFLPTSGVQLPIRYSMQHATDVPKFRTGSDVVLDAAQSDIETRRLDRQSIDISYRKSSPIRRGLSKYTLDALSATVAYSQSRSVNPLSRDSSWTFSSNLGYDLPIGGGGLSLGKKFKINLLPEVIGFNAGWVSSRSVNYSRTLFNDRDSLALRSDAKVRLLTLGTTTSYVPFSSFRVQYTLTSLRDMLQRKEGGLGFNQGTEVDHLQTFSVNWTPRWLSLLHPNINARARYHEDARPERRLSPSDPEGLKNIDNQGSANVRFSLPLSRLGSRTLTRRRAAADSSGGGFSALAPLAPLRYVLGKFQDVQTSFGFDRSATVTRTLGDPGGPFKFGFSEVTAPELRRISGSTFGSNRRFTTNLSTAFRPSNTVNVDVRADHSLTYTNQTFGARRTERFQWPDLKARWTDLHRLLSLGDALKSLTLQSGFSKLNEEEGPQGGPTERRTNTRAFGPLLGWDLVFTNDIRATLTSSLTKATTVDERSGGHTRDRQTTNTDVRLNKTFPAAKGIKLPFSKNRIRLPNDLNLNMIFALQSDYVTSIRTGERPYIETNQERLNVSSGSTYNFSRSISGGFNFAYRQTNDKKSGIKTRGISVEFNAQFAF